MMASLGNFEMMTSCEKFGTLGRIGTLGEIGDFENGDFPKRREGV